MKNAANSRLISIIIPTCNRASLLQAALASLEHQTLPREQYEVVVVDDGCNDATAQVCSAFGMKIPLHYLAIQHSGISAAKNLGIFASTAPLLLFFDDDDIASPNLLAEHVEVHRLKPAENVAVLGYTNWSPGLQVTELMHYITEVGCNLFCYPYLKDGAELDFRHFWGGRSSCKRSFLAAHGVFRSALDDIEDIELGYRLDRLGFKVIYHRNARQYANRRFTFEGFCRRCEKQGSAFYHFARCHGADSRIREYTQMRGLWGRWRACSAHLDFNMARVRDIEDTFHAGALASNAVTAELHRLYDWCFTACRTKGFVAAATRFGLLPGLEN